MTRYVISNSWYVASIPCDDQIRVTMSKLVSDDRGGIPIPERLNGVGVPPVVQGCDGQTKTLPDPLVRSEGR